MAIRESGRAPLAQKLFCHARVYAHVNSVFSSVVVRKHDMIQSHSACSRVARKQQKTSVAAFAAHDANAERITMTLTGAARPLLF